MVEVGVREYRGEGEREEGGEIEEGGMMVVAV